MELYLKQSSLNNAPLLGLLIKGESIEAWLYEIESLDWGIHGIDIYPLPDNKPNTVWGCLIVTRNVISKEEAGKHQRCQLAYGTVFIPEFAQLSPQITIPEAKYLFKNTLHIMHPDIGLFILNKKLDIRENIKSPELKSYYVVAPEAPIFIPSKIKTFYVKPIDKEDPIEELEKSIGKKEKLKDQPLNLAEKAKLFIYKSLLKNKQDSESDNKKSPSGLGKIVAPVLGILFGGAAKLMDKIGQEHDDLEDRNKKEVDKLLDMLRKNPVDALKYAIPIDQKGTIRGNEMKGLFKLSERWSNWSLFNSGGGDGYVNLGSGTDRLYEQYNTTAQQLIDKGDYKKAAFVYLKLLQNEYMAAQTLEKGKHYKEAAVLYLKRLSNEQKAAECFEKGNMYHEAIELQIKLYNNDKVGELYLKLNNRTKAYQHFNKHVDSLKTNRKYYDAALVETEKLNDPNRAQKTYLEAWRLEIEASKCLTTYLSNISNDKKRLKAIRNVYEDMLTDRNVIAFIGVMKNEFKKPTNYSEEIKEIVYQIISSKIEIQPHLVSELKHFNQKDKYLVKDTIKYKRMINKKHNTNRSHT